MQVLDILGPKTEEDLKPVSKIDKKAAKPAKIVDKTKPAAKKVDESKGKDILITFRVIFKLPYQLIKIII